MNSKPLKTSCTHPGPNHRRRALAIVLALAIILWAFAFPQWSAAQTDRAGLEEAFADLYAYRAGDSSGPLENIAAAVAASHGDRPFRKDLEKRLAQLFAEPKVTNEARWFAARQLYVIGTAEIVPQIAPFLLMPQGSDAAIYVLGRMPDSAALQALVAALKRASVTQRVAIINALGARGSLESVPALKAYAGNGHRRVMKAAITALGKVGGREAADTALWCSRNVRYDLRATAQEAYLRCADGFLRAREFTHAADMYDRMFIGGRTTQIRAAGLQGLLDASKQDAADVILEVLTSSDEALYAVAIGAAGRLPGVGPARALASALPTFKADIQIQLLRALGAQGNLSALDAVLRARKHSAPPVRVAALEALGSFPDPSVINVLLSAAVSSNADESVAAKASLRRLSGKGVNDALVRAAMGSRHRTRLESIRLLAARRVAIATPMLLRAAERDIPSLRLEAFKALGAAAGPGALSQMTSLFAGDPDLEVRRAAEDAIVAVARRAPHDENRTEALGEIVNRRGLATDIRLAAVRVLGRIQGDDSLDLLRRALKQSDEAIVTEALRALSAWTDPSPLEDLVRTFRRLDDQAQRSLALDAALRMLAASIDSDDKDLAAFYKSLADSAESTKEKKSVLHALGRVSRPWALELVSSFEGEADVQQEARDARAAIEARLN